LKNFDGIIFDIDGTLTATNKLIFASFNHIAEKYLHKKLTNEEILAQFGPTEDVILKKWTEHRYDEARSDYYDFYEANHEELADIFPGLKKVIEQIKSKNIPLGIFTGKGRESSLITLKAFDILNCFDYIVTGDDVDEHKPSPEGINKFVDTYKLNRERVLMVGDAHVDVIAARDAGVKIASVLWDSTYKEKVLALNPDFVFYTVDEFAGFILNNLE